MSPPYPHASHREQPHSRRFGPKEVGFGTLLAFVAAGAFGAGFNFGLFTGDDTATAGSINRELNGTGHVARHAVVELGYDVDLPKDTRKDAATVHNPIKFGENTYGYVEPIPETGKVKIRKFKTDQPLMPQLYSGLHSKAYPHEVMTSLALVYSIYEDTDAKAVIEHSVIMGDKPGNTDNLVAIYHTSKEANDSYQKSNQLNEIAMSRAGQLVIDGPK